MTTFDKRERALEDRFVHDEEVRFRITARRDKLFALWAIARLGLAAETASGLVAAVMGVRDGAQHDDTLLDDMADAFQRHGHTIQPAELVGALHDCEAQARREVMAEPPGSEAH